MMELSELTRITLQNRLPKMLDNITKPNPLLNRLDTEESRTRRQAQREADERAYLESGLLE